MQGRSMAITLRRAQITKQASLSYDNNDEDIQGVPKKRTFIMLLEPQCTGSITSSRLPLCLEINFLVVSY